ncbi:MAG: septum formation initiator family protein [Fibrobacteria bacterium]|nr:septum formation initiator family protein [Fibrobacteria bacterium]
MSQTHPKSGPASPAGRETRFPLGRWLLLAALAFALYAWTFGPFGVVRQWNRARQIQTIERTNDSLRARTRLLLDSLELFRSDSATIAAEARRQGLVLPGEISVRFVDTTLGIQR